MTNSLNSLLEEAKKVQRSNEKGETRDQFVIAALADVENGEGNFVQIGSYSNSNGFYLLQAVVTGVVTAMTRAGMSKAQVTENLAKCTAFGLKQALTQDGIEDRTEETK